MTRPPHQILTGRTDGEPSVKLTPAMAAGVAQYPWSATQISALLD